MERLINRRQQGDLGEASAIEWLTRQGALVSVPLGHSPDYDLAADFDGRLARVQVKTTTYCETKASGDLRWQVQLATNGGNQSWGGLSKRFDPHRADYLFALVGDGRRWLLPTHAVEATTNVALGGPKYSEFEIDPSLPIRDLVYGSGRAHLESAAPGEYRSGQTGHPVKVLALPSQVRILPPPSGAPSDSTGGSSGTTRVWGKRRITLPDRPFSEAGLEVGDRLRAVADGEGRVLLTRIEPPDTLPLDD